MADLLTLPNAAALATLTLMEVVLGIDNLVFIAVLAERLEESRRAAARKIGLLLAMFMRLGLLFAISALMGLTAPWFSLLGHSVSGRDLILLAGGAFLIYKATVEIHDKLEGSGHTLNKPRVAARFSSVVVQIVLLDAVFSLDSVLTAIGMVDQTPDAAWVPLTIMSTAIVIAILVMLTFAGPISRFIQHHPTTKMLALAFLLLIGVMLVAEGLGQHIGKGYIYAAMTFSLFVELLNLRATRKRHSAPSA